MKKVLVVLLLTIMSIYGADTVSIIAVGDIMVTSRGTAFLDRVGTKYPLDSVRHELHADILIGNQEAPIGPAGTGTKFDKTFAFLTPLRHAEIVPQEGFDVVSLANNHAMDFGPEALQTTMDYLDSNGVEFCGAGMNIDEARTPAIIEKDGVKYGFLAYSNTFPEEFWATSTTAGNPFGHAHYLKEDIPALREQVDYLFVSFHWGSERMDSTKQYQKDLGRLAIDLGADGVFAHHPHVLQGMELYKGKVIAYSLGNFLFASWSNSVWDSAILKLQFADGQFLGAEIVPLLINNFQVELQPKVLTGEKAQKSLTALAALSAKFGTTMTIENDRGYIRPETIIVESEEAIATDEVVDRAHVVDTVELSSSEVEEVIEEIVAEDTTELSSSEDSSVVQ